MGILELLAPVRCGACGQTGPSPCANCVAAMRPATASSPPPRGLDWCRAAVAYDGPARRLVAGLKYRNGRAALPWMVEALAPLVADRPDVITWIPAAPGHRRRRGFDQGRLLARALGRRLGLPARPLLRRLPGPAQTGRSLAARRTDGPRLAPATAGRLDGLAVLVVDDVWTTGSSLTAAAAVLRQSGAAGVAAVTIARTLLKGPLRDTEGNGDGNGEPTSPTPLAVRARTGAARPGSGPGPPAAPARGAGPGPGGGHHRELPPRARGGGQVDRLPRG